MLFQQFEVKGLAHYSYAIGCEQAREVVIVDPKRDVEEYLQYAAENGLRISYVLETHIHADYASGARELAERSGAELCLSIYDRDEMFEVQFPHRELRDQDLIAVGKVEIKALHTPGHTPEHISFLISQRDGSEIVPQLFLTGDFLFIGSLGRPDLLGEEVKRTLAAQLYQSVTEKLSGLNDSLQVYPAHGAGSFCGAGMSNQRVSTLGQERKDNRYLQLQGKKDQFIDAILSGLPPRPAYYLKMKKLNSEGPPLLGEKREIKALEAKEVMALVKNGAVVIDTRDQVLYGAGHIPGSFAIGAGPSLAVWASLVVPYDQPLILLASDQALVLDALKMLSRVGLDQVVGYVDGGFQSWQNQGLPIEQLAQITPSEAVAFQSQEKQLLIVDVRAKSEWEAGHIPGAVNMFGGDITDYLEELRSHQGAVAVACGGGYRSTVAASVLQRGGVKNVINLSGGMSAWNNAGLPIEY